MNQRDSSKSIEKQIGDLAAELEQTNNPRAAYNISNQIKDLAQQLKVKRGGAAPGTPCEGNDQDADASFDSDYS